MARKIVLSYEQQIEELKKCRKQPVYFITKYLVVQHPTKGRQPFHLYPFQEECIRSFIEYDYNVIVKSRQLGLSTATSAFCLWMAMFRQDANILIMANKLEVGKGMIQKLRIYYESLPKWMLEKLGLTNLDAESVRYLKFSNGSKITAIPTTDDAGRGEAVSLFVIDEAAIIPDLEKIWEGVFPTVSSHPGSKFIVFSTPKGKNFFHKMVSEAKEGCELREDTTGRFYKGVGPNRFHAIELPWDVHPERDQKWFDDQTYGMRDKSVAQEFNCDFGGSADTYISQNIIEFYKNFCEVPKKIEGNEFGDEDLWIWKDPEPNHEYVISADVATGVGADFSAFHVIDTQTSEIVAEYMGKIPTDSYAEYLIEIATKYNTALIIQELNAVGIGTANKLKELEYQNLWYEEKLKEKMMYMTQEERRMINPGFTVSPKNRDLILAKLEEVLRNKRIRIFSTRFVEQLEVFMWNGKKAEALKRRNDDLVMALALGLQVFEPSQQVSLYGNKEKGDRAWMDGFLAGIKRNTVNFSPTPAVIDTTTTNSQEEVIVDYGFGPIKKKVNPHENNPAYKQQKMIQTLFPWMYQK